MTDGKRKIEEREATEQREGSERRLECWVESFSKSSQRPYWTNTVTGESRWDRPTEPLSGQKKFRSRAWEERYSRTHSRVYWFDEESGESVWEKPSDLSTPESSIIEPLGFKHKEALLPVVSDAAVMSHIGKGRPWTERDLDKQLTWSEQEWTSDHDNPGRGYYWAILFETNAVGFVGFYRYKPEDPYVLRILLGKSAQGKGLGTRSVKEALMRLRALRPDLEFVDGAAHENNPGGAAVMIKAGFVSVGIGCIGRTPVKNFKYTLQPGLTEGSAGHQSTGANDGKMISSEVSKQVGINNNDECLSVDATN